ncbi:ABC transporter permease [Vagococcus sp. BWB3-3]|uniref:ABC transporter permease n=1 Tax=Vagococcus allomyrinae TaxID=2794353 RepID=A0A940SUM1_9ENTE|nr:ABC transporter permease [Vagococcus allomyrinae]MBP1040949.1 ABC transporter permease [Vagococcus allomyrinae]
MYKTMIKNDIKRSKLMTITITAFIVMASLLTALGAFLSVNLISAIDSAMVAAKTPHFMQMHSGEVDQGQLADFASQQSVKDYQVLNFLNIEGPDIVINKTSLAGSIQDNGVSVQSQNFDFLLDVADEIVYPEAGEIYVPIYYMKEMPIAVGDTVTIAGHPLTIAGFVRDSQMNSAIVSSKRFLVNQADYDVLKDRGKLESLIEFRLAETANLGEFEAAYLTEKMPANGPPAITYPLFKLANGITDGIMIAVLILISLLVIIVTFLCIRFTLLAKIEEDYREIGVLKGIGLRVADIKRIYLAKYGVMAALGASLGFGLALLLQRPLSANIRLYLGESSNPLAGGLFALGGALLIFFVILLYVNGVLRRFRKLSAAQAIRFGAPAEKSKAVKSFRLSRNKLLSANVFLGVKDLLSRKKLYLTMFMVLVISSFIMIVPQNIYNTISSRNFMTYMGIGNSYMRIDVQQVDDIAAKTALIADKMSQDESISQFTVLTSYLIDMQMADESVQRLKVELGDHQAFPIDYSAGRAPIKADEIALSTLNMDDLEKELGDVLRLTIDGVPQEVKICGVYSDVTNGGKTAKAAFETSQAASIWSIIPVTFYDNSLVDDKVKEYQEAFSYGKVSNIDDYIDQTFGSTTAAIKTASYGAIIATILLTVLVTLLFMKLLIAKDKQAIAMLKSIGFSTKDIRRQYLTRSLIVSVLAVLVGVILANTLGEVVGTLLISSFGIASLHFEINPLFAFVMAPLVIGTCVYLATLVGIQDIQSVKISDQIKE